MYVQLSADNEIGSRLQRVFSKGDTLTDANTVAFAVSTAREEILPELKQNIIRNRYLTKEGRRVYSPSGVSITLTSTAGGFGGRRRVLRCYPAHQGHDESRVPARPPWR